MTAPSGGWSRIEVGLVLQGGGALGAYEWGAIEALFDAMDELQKSKQVSLVAVTGVSIGAINGACIVGSAGRADARARLSKLWNHLKFSTPFTGRVPLGALGLPDFAPARDASLFGLPGFYVPRMDVWNAWRWTSLYDTAMLEKTLVDHVNFDAIRSSPVVFVVTAVDVECGTLRRFRNRKPATKPETDRPEENDAVVVFEPRHIVASGSLGPQFPWTMVEERPYWDGGLIDNTPLGDVLDSFSPDDRVYRLLVVMNLYPLEGSIPRNMLEVVDRVHELQFGNRLRQDRASARRVNKLIRAIEALSAEVARAKVDLSDDTIAYLSDAAAYKIVKTVDIQLQVSGEHQDSEDDNDGLRDFSPETIDARRARGRSRAYEQLRTALAGDGFSISTTSRAAA